jgi:hypothetical protein
MKTRLMRALGISLGLVLTASLAAKAGGGSVLETVYVPTTTEVVTLPSSFVSTSYTYYPTSYSYAYLPTSYTYYPTSYSYYAPTTYSTLTPTYYTLADTYYSTTWYRPPGYLFPRRFTTAYSYMPTAYYLSPSVYTVAPTNVAYATSGLSSTEICVDTPGAGTVRANNGGSIPTNQSNRGGSGANSSGVLRSSPTDGSLEEPPLQNTKPPGERKTGAANVEIPTLPARDKEKGDVSPPPPPAPGGSNPADDAAAILRRDSMKPRPGEALMRPAQQKALMQGRVTSGATASPMAGAKVILTNPSGAFERKTYVADAKGEFEIRYLPSGDWKVEVEDAEGKAQSYGTLTVSGGRVTDSDGREWTSLNLNR